jgi:hypothetical protein
MKTRPTQWLLISFLVIMIALLPTMAVLAQEGITEPFDEANPTGWEFSPQAVVSDGVLAMKSEGFAFIQGQWSDLALQVRFKRSGQGEFLVHYLAGEGGEYNLIILPDQIMLEKMQQGTPTSLGVTPYQADGTENWQDLKIAYQSGQHTITLNDQTLITATDSDPIQSGAIAFHVFGEMTVSIDQVQVSGTNSSSQAEAPPGGEITEGDQLPQGEMQEGEPSGQSAPQISVTTSPQSTSAQASSIETLMDALLGARVDQVNLWELIGNLLLAGISSFILGRVYILWGTSLTNRRRFAANFMLITITTTFIILIVRSSIALSLGLVGALSIVRFRNAVKEPEELAYLFFAIGLGIGFGDNQRLITLIALAVGILVITLMRLLRRPDADINLYVSITSQNPGQVELESINAILKKHCSKFRLARFDESSTTLESVYLVEFNSMDRINAIRHDLRALPGAAAISFLDNKGMW